MLAKLSCNVNLAICIIIVATYVDELNFAINKNPRSCFSVGKRQWRKLKIASYICKVSNHIHLTVTFVANVMDIQVRIILRNNR